MGRSVSYLTGAQRIAYFNWPCEEIGVGDDIEVIYEHADYVVEDIQETIKSHFPEFSNCSRWDGREVKVILEGYGCEIGLSEYCGLATLSIRVEEYWADMCDSDELDTEYERITNWIDTKRITNWIDTNWPEISKHWDMYRKVGTFSNGESIYELKK